MSNQLRVYLVTGPVLEIGVVHLDLAVCCFLFGGGSGPELRLLMVVLVVPHLQSRSQVQTYYRVLVLRVLLFRLLGCLPLMRCLMGCLRLGCELLSDASGGLLGMSRAFCTCCHWHAMNDREV